MLGYMLMNMEMSGLRQGSNRISSKDGAMAGYSMAPVDMTMRMHMAHVMYAPTSWVTLMVMPTYHEMDMTMESVGDGHAGHHAGHHHPSEANAHTHAHSISGWGDTIVGGLFPLWRHGRHTLIGSLFISIPTGSVKEKEADGTYTHYGMQLGSGTWDLVPGVTYTGKTETLSWGGQASTTIRGESRNSTGFRRGNQLKLTGWAAWGFTNWASVSARLLYEYEGAFKGHYNGPHNHASPGDFIENYGGSILSTGVGLNLVAPSGALRGHRLGTEILFPLKENFRGIQMSHDYTLNLTWSYAF